MAIPKVGGLTRVLEFPSNDAIPLIQFQWKVAMAANPLRVIFASSEKKKHRRWDG